MTDGAWVDVVLIGVAAGLYILAPVVGLIGAHFLVGVP